MTDGFRPLYVEWIEHKKMVARNLLHRYGPARRFRRFERRVHPATWSRHEELLAWSEAMVSTHHQAETPQRFQESPHAVVREGFDLRQSLETSYRNRYRDVADLRVLIHVPPATVSSAYASLGENFVNGLQFMGIDARPLRWDDSTAEVLQDFRPAVLLSVDHPGYLSRIDWAAIEVFREANPLRIGLNASLEEYGNTPLRDRLDSASQHHVDFYYTFKTQEYVKARYSAILDRGWPVVSMEFGANPHLYYPVPGIERDLNWVFLGSTNPDKWERYYEYFTPLWKEYSGYIDGPWWSMFSRFGAPATYRYICARARVALNLHIPDQIEWAGELNERTYNLAACGVPQLIDSPSLLASRFSPGSLFVARTASDYQMMFARVLKDPEEAESRALAAQREVLAQHTVYHRLEGFLQELAARGLVEASVTSSRAEEI